MTLDVAAYLAAALRQRGRITLVLAPIESYEAVHDPYTDVIRIDPEADVTNAIRPILADLVDGPIERELVALSGGGDGATACGLIPPQAADEDERGGARLRLVRRDLHAVEDPPQAPV